MLIKWKMTDQNSNQNLKKKDRIQIYIQFILNIDYLLQLQF